MIRSASRLRARWPSSPLAIRLLCTNNNTSTVIVSPTQTHTASLIFLHALGDSGSEWEDVFDYMGTKMPHVKFIIPTAPEMYVSAQPAELGAQTSWYDIKSFEDYENNPCDGIQDSCEALKNLIQTEQDAGIETSRIVLAGFDQGAAVACLTTLELEKTLAGTLMIGHHLPVGLKINHRGSKTPFYVMNGDSDDYIPVEWIEKTCQSVENMGHPVKLEIYDEVEHELIDDQVYDAEKWLQEIIPDTE